MKPKESTGRLAFLVAAGILLSRIIGLVRLRVFSHYFGLRSDAADAFNAAFRIPNFLQNLFGEGVLSASFIPVYARLLAEAKDEEAGKVAGRSSRSGAAATTVLVRARRARDAVADRCHRAGLPRREARADDSPGADPVSGRRPAGALGLVPGHSEQPSQVLPFLHRAGNVERGDDRDAARLRRQRRCFRGWRCCWRGDRWPAARCSSACSCRWCCGWRAACGFGSTSHREHVRDGRCATSGRCSSAAAWCRSAPTSITVLASLLPTGAVAALIECADDLHAAGEPVRHVGLGGGAAGDVERARQRDAGRPRIFAAAPRRGPAADRVLRRAVGDGVSGVRRRDGRRAVPDGTLHARRLGLRVGNSGGIVRSDCWRRRWGASTRRRTMRCATRARRCGSRLIRVALTTVLGYVCANPLPCWIGIDPRWGVAGLTASAGVAGWVEFALLRRGLRRRLGAQPPMGRFVAKLWAAAAFAAIAGTAGRFLPLPPVPVVRAAAALGIFGAVYLLVSATFAEEGRRLAARLPGLRRVL